MQLEVRKDPSRMRSEFSVFAIFWPMGTTLDTRLRYRYSERKTVFVSMEVVWKR